MADESGTPCESANSLALIAKYSPGKLDRYDGKLTQLLAPPLMRVLYSLDPQSARQAVLTDDANKWRVLTPHQVPLIARLDRRSPHSLPGK